MADLLEEKIIQWFHLLELKNIERTMKVLRPRVEEIGEEGWSKLAKAHSLLQKIRGLAQTEHEKLSDMAEIRNHGRYRDLLMLKKEEFVGCIDSISKDLEDWLYKKQGESSNYTLTEIGFGSKKRGVEKDSKETLNEIRALLNSAMRLFENFKKIRFERNFCANSG